ncbi:DUF7344 domain-containing protein [Natrinema halophilum]|uniref:DUF7344 domain-containing protein n=1 Tax=Natrinema halophilum TaxID=1699371 RepID=A0A7D5GRR2_9EURY|nr:hypothetical protein [Natrinema halophilum]QLG48206.1 hypothetical protein HYG82_04765 [Natrinema halophilum]
MRETEGETAALTADTTPSLSLVFELLSNCRRRYALYYLNDQPDGVASVEALTENVLTLERTAETNDADDAVTTSSTFDLGSDREPVDKQTGIRTELTHVHLPKLEDAGILEHDRRSETVRYWSQPSLEEWLEHAYHKEVA